MRLGGADAVEVIDAANRFGQPGPAFPSRACRIVRELVPCDVITFNQVFVAEGTTTFVVEPDGWVDRMHSARGVMERLAHEHPIVAHYVETGGGRPLRVSDVGDAWTGTELYREYFAPLGLHWQLVLAVPSPEDRMNIVALSRCDEDFSDRDVAVLHALRPHLTLGCRSSTAATLPTDTAVAGGWTVITIDADGRVSALSEPDPTDTFVVGEPAPEEFDLADDERDVALGDTVHVRADDHQWMVRQAGIGTDPLVLLAQTISSDTPGLFDLTPRQRQVLSALAEGHTNAQIARRLGIADATVKKHLEHIYATLGVDNRVAAVAALSA